jgi:hypothetical protein
MENKKSCLSNDIGVLFRLTSDTSIPAHERIVAACRLLNFEWKSASRAAQIPNSSGVYVFYDFRDCFYVGKSTRLRYRISGHGQRNGGHIIYIEIPIELIALREIQLIGMLLPLFNRETCGLSEEFRATGELKNGR